MFIYDPVRPVVLHSENGRLTFSVRSTDGKFNMAWGWFIGNKQGSTVYVDVRSFLTNLAGREPGGADGVGALCVDVRSLLTPLAGSGPSENITVVRDGRLLRLRTPGEAGALVFATDPVPPAAPEFLRAEVARATPFAVESLTSSLLRGPLPSRGPASASLGIYWGGNEKEPFLELGTVRVNCPVPDELFAFPDLERLRETLELRDCNSDSVFKTLDVFMLWTRAGHVRVALRAPEMRNSIPFPGLDGINWDEVRKHDDAYAKVLRDLVPREPKFERLDLNGGPKPPPPPPLERPLPTLPIELAPQ
jgi:hypothetical protein